MNPNIKVVSLALTYLFSHCIYAESNGWSTNFLATKSEAAASHKDIIVDFAGSDWCGICNKLDQEIFAQDKFREIAANKFVFMRADIPRHPDKMPTEVFEQNKKLASTYNVTDYPTVLLLDSEGRPYAATGYISKLTPEEYANHLIELRKNKLTRDKTFAVAASQTGIDKAKTLATGLRELKLSANSIKNNYADTLAQIKQEDPEDQTGFFKEQFAHRTAEEGQVRRRNLIMRATPKMVGGDLSGCIKDIEEFLAQPDLTADDKLLGYYLRALSYKKQGAEAKADEALEIAAKAVPAGEGSPDSVAVKEAVQRMIEAQNEEKNAKKH